MDHAQLLSDATRDLIAAHQTAHGALVNLSNAKRALALEEASIILAGLPGKNQAERDAQLVEATHQTRGYVTDEEDNYRAAQLEVTQRELNHQLARHLLNLHIAQLGATNTQ